MIAARSPDAAKMLQHLCRQFRSRFIPHFHPHSASQLHDHQGFPARPSGSPPTTASIHCTGRATGRASSPPDALRRFCTEVATSDTSSRKRPRIPARSSHCARTPPALPPAVSSASSPGQGCLASRSLPSFPSYSSYHTTYDLYDFYG